MLRAPESQTRVLLGFLCLHAAPSANLLHSAMVCWVCVEMGISELGVIDSRTLLAELVPLFLSVLYNGISITWQNIVGGGIEDSHTVIPCKQCRNQLQNLKFLWIRTIESQEVDEMVRDNLPGNRSVLYHGEWVYRHQTYLSTISSGLRCLIIRNAFVR